MTAKSQLCQFKIERDVFSDGGNLADAEAVVRMRLARDVDVYGPESEEAAVSMNTLGIVLDRKGAYDEALGRGTTVLVLRWYLKCLAIKEKHYGPDDPEVASTLVNIGLVYKT